MRDSSLSDLSGDSLLGCFNVPAGLLELFLEDHDVHPGRRRDRQGELNVAVGSAVLGGFSFSASFLTRSSCFVIVVVTFILDSPILVRLS